MNDTQNMCKVAAVVVYLVLKNSKSMRTTLCICNFLLYWVLTWNLLSLLDPMEKVAMS